MAPRSSRRVPTSARKRRHDTTAGLRCERLEDRVVPALFNVQTALTFPAGTMNNNGCVASADFDKDGRADAVLTNYGSTADATDGNTIVLLYSRPTGGFSRVALSTGGTNVSFVSVTDINGDTWPDLVVSNGNQQGTGSISVFRNDGAGSLSLVGTPFLTAGNNASWVGMADVTGDGILDAVVANLGTKTGPESMSGNRITVFQGNAVGGIGDFTFASNPLITLAPQTAGIEAFVPTALAVADFDGDGIVDIAGVSQGVPPNFGEPYPEGYVAVFKGTGSGGFAEPSIIDTGGVLPVNIQAADINGDNKKDLIVSNAGDPGDISNLHFNWTNNSVSVLRNTSSLGNVSFFIPTILATNCRGPFAAAIADYDLDGDMDIASINYGSPTNNPVNAFVSAYLGNGLGAFTPASPGTFDTATAISGGQYLAAGDFDANGTPDLIVAHDNNKVGLLLNTSTPQVVTTTSLVSSLNPSGFSESVTFTATVSATGETVTGGTVTFFDNGVQMGSPVTVSSQQAAFTTTTLTVGTHTITATYSGAGEFSGSTSGNFSQVVNSGAAQTFTFSGVPASTFAGTQFNFTVTARDQFGNGVNGYRGTVHFTSSDGQAVLPQDYTFTAADNGAHTFTLSLRTAGSQSFTVTDTAAGSITGTANTTVNAIAATHFVVEGFPTSTGAGDSHDLTVTAKDFFGNTATSYRGTIQFSSSDGQATLPADYAFTAADNGVHTFAATLRTAGTQSLTGTDTATGSISGSQSGITVTAATATTLTISGLPSSVNAGASAGYTVTARDAFGNTAASYRGTVHFTSSDGSAVLPADYAFTAGDAGLAHVQRDV